VNALAGHHDEEPPNTDAATSDAANLISAAIKAGITGRFEARVWDLDCLLELHLDETGQPQGSFSADGEPLEITCERPHSNGAFVAVIRAKNMKEPFATFQARLHEDGLHLEVNGIDLETGLETIEHLLFARLS
jgi:hypothetical protein